MPSDDVNKKKHFMAIHFKRPTANKETPTLDQPQQLCHFFAHLHSQLSQSWTTEAELLNPDYNLLG